MFKALGLYEENAETKKVREGGKEEEERQREKGSENYEGHRPIISHTISEISWISFIRIYES